MNYKILDISLFKKGKEEIECAKRTMPILQYVNNVYSSQKPFTHIKISGTLNINRESAVFIETLVNLGAEVSFSASNPLFTQDHIAAYLVNNKISIYGWSNMSNKDFYWAFDQILNLSPQVIVDDSAELFTYIYLNKLEQSEKILGFIEQTSNGIYRIRIMEKKNMLKHPVIAINDSFVKKDFNNIYGTGQSILDSIVRATGILIAGKKVVVSGYGSSGLGIANRAKGLGANVIITEVSSTLALKAIMDGHSVLPMEKASPEGDIFITTAGIIDVLKKEHFMRMKDGAILVNTGNYNSEISIKDLEELSYSKKEVRKYVKEYSLNNKKIYLLADGIGINLVYSNGYPSEIIDLSYANQVLALINLIDNYKTLSPKVYTLPNEIDEQVSLFKLKSIGIELDQLTNKQKDYRENFSLKF